MRRADLFLILGISCLLTACREEPRVYHRTEAIQVAEVKLAEYAKQGGLELEKFKGPYTRPTDEMSNTSYEVCYLHPEHYFCYYEFTNMSDGALKRETDPDNSATKRLQSLDPYGVDWFTEETP